MFGIETPTRALQCSDKDRIFKHSGEEIVHENINRRRRRVSWFSIGS